MIALRVALLAALLAASSVARAQQDDASDVAPPLRAAVAAYRAGDLAAAEAALRALAASDADAEAWLGAVLLDRGADREGLRHIQRAADAGSSEGAHRLALVYAQGLAGTPRNDSRALELFEKAAAAGHHARPDQSRHPLSARPGRAARSRPGARLAREGGGRRRSPGALRAGPRHGRKAPGRPSPTRCAPPISIAAPPRRAMRWPGCAMAWR